MPKKKTPPKPVEAATPKTLITVRCPRPDSFRVQQVAGMFDLQLQPEIVEQFAVEIPPRAELINGQGWQIGCIVGPSGSGKSSVARAAFGQELHTGRDWPADRAVVDAFEPADRSIRDITGMLTAVGFSSPPSWIKPYQVLSNGEKFRCDLARALLETGDGLLVFDEFTSVVDRTVAKVGSAAVAKAIRRLPGLQFVAVSCHYDIVEWLAPDWVLDMQSQTLTRRSLRRPGIELKIYRSDTKDVWRLFKKHHYLNHDAPPAARYYVGCVDEQPACLVVTAPNFGKCRLDRGFKQVRRIARIVTLPDFQGIGLGGAMLDAVAELHAEEGLQARIVTSHPGMIARLRHAPRWQVTNFVLGGKPRGTSSAIRSGLRKATAGDVRTSGTRYILSAKYIGEPQPPTPGK